MIFAHQKIGQKIFFVVVFKKMSILQLPQNKKIRDFEMIKIAFDPMSESNKTGNFISPADDVMMDGGLSLH